MGDGLAKLHDIAFALTPVHLVGKERHGQIGQMQFLAPAGYPVEPRAVVTNEMDRHDVALKLDAFLEKTLVPCQVADGSVRLATTAQSGWEHDDMAVAAKSLVYPTRKVVSLTTQLVHRHAQGSQAAEIHQEVIHQILHPSVEARPYHPPQRDTIYRAQRMVAHKGVTLRHVHRLHIHVEPLACLCHKVFQKTIAESELELQVRLACHHLCLYRLQWHSRIKISEHLLELCVREQAFKRCRQLFGVERTYIVVNGWSLHNE